MKHRKIKGLIFLGFISSSLLFLCGQNFNSAQSSNQIKFSSLNISGDSLKLIIDGRGEEGLKWSQVAINFWCTGTGEKNDPYSISGISFGYLEIKNSDDYFIFTNCTFTNEADSFHPVRIQNVQNGIFQQNDFLMVSGMGMLVLSSKNLKVYDNYVWAKNYGLYFDDSQEIEIKENELYNNDIDGILLSECSDLIIEENEFLQNGVGLFLTKGNEEISVLNNEFNVNGIGINLWKSSGNSITGNKISYSNVGIILEQYSHSNSISYNEFGYNQVENFKIGVSCENNVISGNTPNFYSTYNDVKEIDLLDPVSGETIKSDVYTIKWKSIGCGDNITIELYKNDSLVHAIQDINNTGTFNFNFSCYENGEDYSILIFDSSNKAIKDKSGYFEVKVEEINENINENDNGERQDDSQGGHVQKDSSQKESFFIPSTLLFVIVVSVILTTALIAVIVAAKYLFRKDVEIKALTKDHFSFLLFQAIESLEVNRVSPSLSQIRKRFIKNRISQIFNEKIKLNRNYLKKQVKLGFLATEVKTKDTSNFYTYHLTAKGHSWYREFISEKSELKINLI